MSVKLRSPLYDDARSVLEGIEEDGRRKHEGRFPGIEGLIVIFWEYMKNYLFIQYVMLYREFEYMFVPMVNRFMDMYRRRTMMKLKPLNNVKFDLHMTLTLNVGKFDNLMEEFEYIKKYWSYLLTFLKHKYPRFRREGYFLCVLEVTAVGRPHLHILLYGIKYLHSDMLQEKWASYGKGGICNVRRANVNGYRYVMKYVTKSVSGGDEAYSALLFASNCRVYSMSRRLGEKLKTEKGDEYKGWAFVMIVSLVKLDKWMMLNEVPLNMSFKADIPDFDRYLYG